MSNGIELAPRRVLCRGSGGHVLRALRQAGLLRSGGAKSGCIMNRDTIEKLSSAAESRWGKWARVAIGAVVGALVAAGVLTVTGCTVSPTRAEQLRTLDQWLHQYGYLMIRVEAADDGTAK